MVLIECQAQGLLLLPREICKKWHEEVEQEQPSKYLRIKFINNFPGNCSAKIKY